jgi:hypothetical protein
MTETPPTLAKSSYASVNGLEMYYETQGTDRPLVLLHGALGTIAKSELTNQGNIAVQICDFSKKSQIWCCFLLGFFSYRLGRF